MARYAIDARTLLHMVDHGTDIHPAHQLVAPNSIRSEALQLMLEEVSMGRRSDEDALRCHETITELKMRLLGDRVSRRTAWRLARERHWKCLRDAEYLAVAMLQADALVTVDDGLAVKAHGLVRTAPVQALARGD
jgi:hypothetical protein